MQRLRRPEAAAIGLLALLLSYSAGIEPRLLYVERVTARVPGLPQEWEGQEIAFISDFQVGIWLANVDTARRAVAWVVQRRPAAVLLGGDFLYKSGPRTGAQVATVVDLLSPLQAAGIPTYAVLGNQDHAAAGILERALAEIGITVLANDSAALPAPGGGSQTAIHVVGIASHQPIRLDRPRAAVATVPAGAPRIVIMHNPESFEDLPAGTAPVAVAGHTHGGQVRIPFTPPQWSWTSLIFSGEALGHGWMNGYGREGNHLYVSRGIGMSWAPIRFSCPPELTLLVLERA